MRQSNISNSYDKCVTWWIYFGEVKPRLFHLRIFSYTFRAKWSFVAQINLSCKQKNSFQLVRHQICLKFLTDLHNGLNHFGRKMVRLTFDMELIQIFSTCLWSSGEHPKAIMLRLKSSLWILILNICFTHMCTNTFLTIINNCASILS